VLLFDLKNWRCENIYERMLDVLGKKKHFRLPDQMLINNAIPERLMKVLPQKFNYWTHYYHPRQERSWLRIGHYFSDDEIEEAVSHPAIVHYLGGWVMARPWYEACRSHCQEPYLRYKALSPWKDSPLFTPNYEVAPVKGLMQHLGRWRSLLAFRQPSFTLARLAALAYEKITEYTIDIRTHDKNQSKKGKIAKIAHFIG
jgi:lipopolysaccharide biosynthesis glycosyltransferase